MRQTRPERGGCNETDWRIQFPIIFLTFASKGKYTDSLHSFIQSHGALSFILLFPIEMEIGSTFYKFLFN